MKWWFTLAPALFALGYLARSVRQRGLDRWIVPYLLQGPWRPPGPGEPIHVLICIADHFEPRVGAVSPQVARERVERWVRDYPTRFGSFRDSDGRTPRHTFFFPIEEYDPEHLDALAKLCGAGFGEIELHLHHDNDTDENLRKTLLTAQELFARRHGLLSHDRRTGRLAYGFIHGNWALDNSRPDGRWCGVNNEPRCPARDRMLRRFHLPLGSQPDPASQDQQHLLCGRRPAPSPFA